jgi:predicted ATPase/HPt (histidine-containing phosphotransfer) domain-containing protein
MGVEAYEMREILAQSATTSVRRARRSDGTLVVIKSLNREYPSARELGQLEFEYRLLQRLAGPGIVRTLGLERDGNGLALLLEDFGGKSLAQRAEPVVPVERVLDIAVAVVRALGRVHAHDVIHKDITPGNVLVNPETGEVKLIDFGIASELRHEQQGSDAAQGTLPYLSPEQTGRMNRDVDYRSDYYSLGVTLFELLTGRLPFDAEDVMGWVHCHISKPAPGARDTNPSVPLSLSRVVAKLLAKDPDERYQSAHGLLQDLESCRAEWKSASVLGDFTPGRHDVPERFQLSQPLFGRERETATLLETFERASDGQSKLLLVGGYSGVGKSALVHELYPSIVARHGHFVAGKFDQLERNVPYGALIQAIRRLIQQILGEPDARLRAWQERLTAAVGAHGQVLVDLVPELAPILGPQPPVPALDPREAQARFLRVFTDFMKAAARPEHPIVVFIDDLQWADPSTPGLLVALLTDRAVEHLLVVGAYRDNEVQEGHLLRTAIAQIREQRPDAVLEIALVPLSESAVNQIVADTLSSTPERSAPLAALIAEKTGGNPFFVKELLALLARADAFHFAREAGRWEWDLDKVRTAALSDNVVELMVERLQKLPPATLEMLRIAACMGGEFGLEQVALIAAEPAGKVAAALLRAVEERVLVPLGNGYRLIQTEHEYDADGLATLAIRYQFQHDRVQQAAYSLLGPEERARAHLAIGRLLLAGRPGARADGIFELVNHFNLGRALITSAEERAALAARNESAGRRAKQAAAYAVAAAYFGIAVELGSDAAGASQSRRHFEWRLEAAECVYYAGDPEHARALCDELAANAPDVRARVAVLELRARIYCALARLMDAIAVLREALGLLGLSLPEDPAEIERQIGEGIGKMQAHLARVRIEDFVELPEMTDEHKILVNDLLYQLVVPSIQAFPPLFILSELLMFDLALTHGTTRVSCKNFVDCGIIQGPALGDYERAYRLGKVAFEFLKRDGSRHLAAAVGFVFSTFVSHWRAPYRESLAGFAEAERWALEFGDVEHGLYAQALGTQRCFFVGQPLDACQARLDSAVAAFKHARSTNLLNGIGFVERAVAELRGTPADLEFLERETEDAFTARLVESRNAQWQFLHGHARVLVNVLFGDFAAAERWLAFASERALTGGNIHFSLPDHFLFDVLLGARRLATTPEAERAALLQRLGAVMAKLEGWAQNSPRNFAHKHKFAAAELARAQNEPMHSVVGLYTEALTLAGDDFPHVRALVNERLAEYWTSAGQPRIARLFLEEAYFLYERWGAAEKLRQLRRAHPRIFDAANVAEPVHRSTLSQSHGSGLVREGALDVESMIKATRTISGEVKGEKLFAKLMATIIENAGAQRGCLILKSDATDELRVEATAAIEGEVRGAVGVRSIDECRELSPDIVRYVARSGDTVVLDDATQDWRYRDDAHVARDGVKSLLCLPIRHQNKLLAILYAENNATTHAFTAERLRLLQIIAGQAAISITNARLYDNLEARVAERTHELVEKNQEVAAMLNSMQQGVFTIDQELKIQPRYSAHLEAILGVSALAGADCVELLFRDAELEPDAVATLRSALLSSFGAEVFIAELNWHHLLKAFERRTPRGERQELEVDWNPITGDDGVIRKLLVTVRDVTSLKQLHATLAKNTRELDIVGQILEVGTRTFELFCDGSHAALRDVERLLRAGAAPSREVLEVAFRELHTLKGNARSLGLSHLAESIHRAEESYVELRSNAALVPDRDALLAGVERVSAALGEYEDVRHEKLAERGRDPDSRQNQAFAAISSILRENASGSLAASQALAQVDAAVRRATLTPLRELVSDTGRMLPSLARELGKAVPAIEYTGSRIELAPEWSGVLRDVLVHTFRNAIDHGIEPGTEREARGKSAHGRISVHGGKTGNRVIVRVFDDGSGLRLDSLRAKLGDGASGDAEIADRVFLGGVSTVAHASHVSGRGVGLHAVRAFMRKGGGEARIAFTGAGADGKRPFELVLEFPEDAGVTEAHSSIWPAELVAAG